MRRVSSPIRRGYLGCAAIDDAIKFGAGGIGTFTSDGEGYHLTVIESDDISKAAMPYHDNSINHYEGVKFNQESRFEKAYNSCKYAKRAA